MNTAEHSMYESLIEPREDELLYGDTNELDHIDSPELKTFFKANEIELGNEVIVADISFGVLAEGVVVDKDEVGLTIREEVDGEPVDQPIPWESLKLYQGPHSNRYDGKGVWSVMGKSPDASDQS